MKQPQWYIDTYGNDELRLTGNTMSVPTWMIMFLRARTSLRSKKKRIMKKVMSKELNRLLIEGYNVFKEEQELQALQERNIPSEEKTI